MSEILDRRKPDGKDHSEDIGVLKSDTYIGDCCKIHDETCSTSKFYKCLKGKVGSFHASYITLGGALGCLIKYPIKMIRRI